MFWVLDVCKAYLYLLAVKFVTVKIERRKCSSQTSLNLRPLNTSQIFYKLSYNYNIIVRMSNSCVHITLKKVHMATSRCKLSAELISCLVQFCYTIYTEQTWTAWLCLWPPHPVALCLILQIFL